MYTPVIRLFSYSAVFVAILLHTTAGSLLASSVQTDNATVELIADRSSITPGEEFNVALTFKLREHWHVYWQNPGASGLPVEIDWTLPEGVKAGKIIWPTPERIELGGLINYGYEDQVTFVVPMKTTSALSLDQELVLRADAFWLICKELCLPEEGSFQITLTSTATRSAPINQANFQAAKASWPLPNPSFSLRAEVDDTRLVINIQVEDDTQIPADLYFYAQAVDLADPNGRQELEFIGPREARLLIPLADTFDPGSLKPIVGVLQSAESSWTVTVNWKSETTITQAVQPPTQLQAPRSSEGGRFEAYFLEMGLPGWLLLAFLGGAILNVMPCVLPVLSLKVFSLLSHTGESRRQSLFHGLAYTVGVVASFVLLAGILLGLRALGERIGWGFQLQNPAFIVILFLLFFLFALNLMGVFEIGTSLVGADTSASKRKDLAGSFGMGVLAAVVGAPCVGPLLASVGGIAVQAAPTTGLLIFAMMGFGLAAPFLILAVFPKLVSYLPKPGAWMETFKHIMGFLLLAAALFIVAVAGASGGVNAILALLIAALTASIAAWCYGRWATPVKPRRTRGSAALFSAILLAGTLYLSIRSVQSAYAAEANISAQAPDSKTWGKWSEERVQTELQAGNPVFVDFTASWCLICQVNKKVALRTENTAALFAEKGIVSLEADWTRYDPEITNTLERYGRSGVPLYLLYTPDGSVEILPQSLTPGTVEAAVLNALAR